MKSFRDRSKQFIISAINQRMHMLRSGANPTINTDDMRRICEILRNDIILKQSDNSMANFFIRNADRILSIIPKKGNFMFSARNKEYRLLLSQAREIITNHTPQNILNDTYPID